MASTFAQFVPEGTISIPRVAGSGTTPFVQLIPPFMGPVGSPASLVRPGLVTSAPNTQTGKYIARLTRVTYTTGATAQIIQILRPLNYTWITAAAAKNATTLTLFDDPGIFSTNYKYPTPGAAAVTQVANNGIGAASTPFVVLQLADGTWFATAVTSYSAPTLTITTALPNVTASTGMLQFQPVYYFVPGTTQLDPATGLICPSYNIIASQTRDQTWSDGGTGYGIAEALHTGDPLLFYSPNNGNTGSLEFISGYHTAL